LIFNSNLSNFILGNWAISHAPRFNYFCPMHKYLITLLMVMIGVAGRAQNIAGIGAQLMLDTAGGWSMPRIMSLVKGSPAWDSLRATDYIVEVEGVSCRDKSINDVVNLIRGEVGTPVNLVTANTKEGEAPRHHTLVRVGMNLGQPPADPKEAFFADCDMEVKAMKQQHTTIVKTFNSDCGSFFFNFNAKPGTYHVRLLARADGKDKNAAFGISARVFDNDHEADAVNIGSADAKTATNGVARTEGTITLGKECVCTVSTSLQGAGCVGMYVVVYTPRP
jgi:hypothetical protein